MQRKHENERKSLTKLFETDDRVIRCQIDSPVTMQYLLTEVPRMAAEATADCVFKRLRENKPY